MPDYMIRFDGILVLCQPCFDMQRFFNISNRTDDGIELHKKLEMVGCWRLAHQPIQRACFVFKGFGWSSFWN